MSTFDPHSDSRQRCPRCGRFMTIREERHEAGDADVWHECMNEVCQRIERDALNAYWASVDIDKMREAFESVDAE